MAISLPSRLVFPWLKVSLLAGAALSTLWQVRCAFVAGSLFVCSGGGLLVSGWHLRWLRGSPISLPVPMALAKLATALLPVASRCVAGLMLAGWLRVPGLFWVGSFVVRGRLARGLAQTCFWSRVSVTVVASGSSGSLSGSSPLCSVLRTTICYRLELGSTLVRKRFAVGCRW